MPYVAWKTPIAMKMFRVAKFKQRAQLSKNPYLASMPSLSGGACVGVTFCWLNRHTQQPAESATKRCAFLSQDDTWCRIESYCSAFNTTGAATQVGRINRNLPNLCGVLDRSSTTAEGYGGLSALAQHINATGPGYYVWLFTFEGGGPAHVCALYDNGSTMTFFDPNSGEYRVPSIGKQAFFGLLYKHYVNYLSGTGVRVPHLMHEHHLVQLGS